MTTTSLPKLVLDELVQLFHEQKKFAEKAIAQVCDEKLREALHPETNSIAVIMKHIAGNLVSRFTDFLTTDGEKPDRHRDNEFVDDFRSRDELINYWERGWNCLFSALAGLTPNDLEKTVTIRGERHSVVKALDRSVTHLAYHVGQIVLIARVHAGKNWNVLTIPRGGSEEFNRKTWKQ
jgi:hypothetical protein